MTRSCLLLSLTLAALPALADSQRRGPLTFWPDGTITLQLTPEQSFDVVETSEGWLFVRIEDLRPEGVCDGLSYDVCLKIEENLCAHFVAGAHLGYFRWGTGYENYECYLPWTSKEQTPYFGPE